jgi:hypothetical protein
MAAQAESGSGEAAAPGQDAWTMMTPREDAAQSPPKVEMRDDPDWKRWLAKYIDPELSVDDYLATVQVEPEAFEFGREQSELIRMVEEHQREPEPLPEQSREAQELYRKMIAQRYGADLVGGPPPEAPPPKIASPEPSPDVMRWKRWRDDRHGGLLATGRSAIYLQAAPL